MCASQPRVASTMAVPFEAQRELKPAESMCLMSDQRSELYRNQALSGNCCTPATDPQGQATQAARIATTKAMSSFGQTLGQLVAHRCHRHISDSKPLNTSAIVVYRVALKGEFQTGSQTCLLGLSVRTWPCTETGMDETPLAN